MVEAVDTGRRHDWEGGRVWYRREGAGRPIVFALRDRLGYDERPLVVCTVGGTAVGAGLLPLCAAAFPRLARRVDGVRMLLVCGPRIEPAPLGAPDGVEVRGHLPRLYEHLAACDAAVVRGGGTTTLGARHAAALIYELAGECVRGDAHVGHVAGGTLDEDGRASSRDLQSAPRHWAERTREEARS
jgi:hypothetical protein